MRVPERKNRGKRGDTIDEAISSSIQKTRTADFARDAIELQKRFFEGDNTCLDDRTQELSTGTGDDAPEILRTRQPPEQQIIERDGRIDDYEIIEDLGQGGLARVYRARKGKQEFALKVPLQHGEIYSQQIQNEINALLKINWAYEKLHELGWVTEPSIIRMHDFRNDDLNYIVLELLDQTFERKRPEKTGRRTACAGDVVAGKTEIIGQQPVKVALFIYDTLHAIEFLHQLDIVHRDIKYQNTMAKYGESGQKAKLFDFGAALDLREEQQVRTAQMVMSPPYISKHIAKLLSRYLFKGNGFFQNCNYKRLGTILKTADIHAAAHATAHLLTGIMPYSLTSSEPEIDPETGRPIYPNPLNNGTNLAFTIMQIRDHQEDPLHTDKIRQQPMGETYTKVLEKLLDPEITRPGKLNEVYELLKEGTRQPAMFKPYKASELQNAQDF